MKKILLFKDWLAVEGLDFDELRSIARTAAHCGCTCKVLSEDGAFYDVCVEGGRLYQFMQRTFIGMSACVIDKFCANIERR